MEQSGNNIITKTAENVRDMGIRVVDSACNIATAPVNLAGGVIKGDINQIGAGIGGVLGGSAAVATGGTSLIIDAARQQGAIAAHDVIRSQVDKFDKQTTNPTDRNLLGKRLGATITQHIEGARDPAQCLKGVFKDKALDKYPEAPTPQQASVPTADLGEKEIERMDNISPATRQAVQMSTPGLF